MIDHIHGYTQPSFPLSKGSAGGEFPIQGFLKNATESNLTTLVYSTKTAYECPLRKKIFSISV